MQEMSVITKEPYDIMFSCKFGNCFKRAWNTIDMIHDNNTQNWIH